PAADGAFVVDGNAAGKPPGGAGLLDLPPGIRRVPGQLAHPEVLLACVEQLRVRHIGVTPVADDHLYRVPLSCVVLLDPSQVVGPPRRHCTVLLRADTLAEPTISRGKLRVWIVVL